MLTYALAHFQMFLLVLLRMVAFIAASPVTSVRSWPTWSKLGLACFIAMLVTPTVHANVPSAFSESGAFILMALRESAIGIAMGFFVSMLFAAVHIAGQLVDIQIGFSSATLFEPAMGMPGGLMGSFQSLLFTLYFLGMNGLQGLVLAVMQSYRFVGLGHFALPQGTWSMLTHLFGVVMALGVELAAPLFATLLLTDITFALLSRAVPQMNVYVVGMPAKLFVGLSFFAGVMPGVVYLFGQLFSMIFSELQGFLAFLGG